MSSIRRAGLAALVVATLASCVPPPRADHGDGAPPGAVAPGEPIEALRFEGRGFGHGIGLSQYGAYGWAVDHGWSWLQILDHYYGGTERSTVTAADHVPDAAGRVTVRLQALDGVALTVVSTTGAARWSGDPSNRLFAALTAREVPGTVARWRIWGSSAATCPPSTGVRSDPGAGWTLLGEVTGTARFVTARMDDPAAGPDDLLAVCEPGGRRRWYRGALHARNGTEGEDRAVNDVLLESYLRGVVPREVPASWGDAAGGAGMHTLRAQAVAARSYALAQASSGRGRWSYARTCDTQSCQVYGGAATQSPGGTRTATEDRRTDRAIAETAGEVRRAGNGRVVTAMFSSSNGGWTWGGPFPVVADPADGTRINPNHTWSAEVTAEQVVARWPQLGELTGVTVVGRAGGPGTVGERATRLRLAGAAGTAEVTTDEMRRAFGLRSAWFDVVPVG